MNTAESTLRFFASRGAPTIPIIRNIPFLYSPLSFPIFVLAVVVCRSPTLLAPVLKLSRMRRPHARLFLSFFSLSLSLFSTLLEFLRHRCPVLRVSFLPLSLPFCDRFAPKHPWNPLMETRKNITLLPSRSFPCLDNTNTDKHDG